MGPAQNLATGRDGIFHRLSCPVLGRPGTKSLSIFSYDLERTFQVLERTFPFRMYFSHFRTSFIVLELPFLF
jgi:hypothetical protein